MNNMTVIGNKDCPRCDIAKNILIKSNTDFKYVIFDDMNAEDKENLLVRATEKKINTLPIIVFKEELIDFVEFIKTHQNNNA